MKHLLPVSKAKTAYGILSEVVKLVLEEPKRMRMAMWGGNDGNVDCLNLPINERPSCGTVGCIGGWIEHQARQQGVEMDAADLLKMDPDGEPISALFYGRLCSDPRQGTPAHARKVVRLIRSFQRKHRTHLLKTRIVQ